MISDAHDLFLETLANRRRLTIIEVLRKGPKNVSEIVKKTKLEQSSVSHNLRRLETCGFVAVKRQGKQRIYTLNQKTIKPLLSLMEKHINTYCKKCIEKGAKE